MRQFHPPLSPCIVQLEKTADKALLEVALTHASSRGESAFERHEFLGDRVVGYLVARHVFAEHPTLPLGALTRLLAVNVDTERLARAAVAHGLHRFLRHNLISLSSHIRDFSAEIADYPVHSIGLVTSPKIMGAVDIDSSHDQEQVWKVFGGWLIR
ncbi:hypothetical protein E2562_024322 [Oryza meyeriana var. granulata]|uniref:RNase III domain-containing protein n=1 Tax=Oryza meyeriana var. granulata TaxID=110450 RepID=A0A6G1C7M6_9ORYZ|nr:hypothetical protein E2562_024322 [Oryza meyeriana var. granulata]